MKLKLTTTVHFDADIECTVTSTVSAFSEDREDVQGHWLDRHAHAIKALTQYEIDIRKVAQ